MSAVPRHRKPQSVASSVPTKTTQQTLARRLLAHSGSNDDLPPLLANQSLPPEITAELYDFIALALRAFVNTWWTKITRYDKEFLPHINKILTHVIGRLEERLVAVDLAPLVFQDIPTIVTQHYIDYRNAQAKLSTSYASGGASSLPALFAQMQPHMAILPDGRIDSEYYRQIVDQILRLCLPPEDYEPEVERSIIREIIVKIVVNDIMPKLSQPWFIHKSILDLAGTPEESIFTPSSVSPPSQDSSLVHSVVVLILSALQSFSGICLALMHSYRQTVNTIKLVNQSPTQSPRSKPQQLNLTGAAPVSLELPASIANSRTFSTTSTMSSSQTIIAPPAPPQPEDLRQDYLSPPISMLSEIILSQDRYSSTLIMTTLSMLSTSMITFMDKFCVHMLSNLLSPAFILNIIRTSKRTLFPNGYPGPPPVDPTPEEQAELRARLVAWKPKGGLAHILPVILGSDSSATLSMAIEPLSEAQCNARLLIFIFDRVLFALFPELVN